MYKYTKIQAGCLLRKAVKDGVIKKEPCGICQSLLSEAHHPDYSKPLDVMWLCRKHHAVWHKENGFPKAKIVVRKMKQHLINKMNDIILELKKEGWSISDIKKIFNNQQIT